MWKILGTFVLMVACGLVAYVMALTFFMNLGGKLHNNYEYYGNFPVVVIVFGIGVIGFLTPGVVVWYRQKR